MQSNPLLISGLPYVHHESWFKLNIAPLRASLEHQLGLVRELQTVSAKPLTVFISGNALSKEYEFATAMLKHYNMSCTCEVTDALDVMYMLTGAPTFLHEACLYVISGSGQQFELPRYVLFRMPTNGSVKTTHIYVRDTVVAAFVKHFHGLLRGLESNVLHFNNLINLCIMVKNAGPLFRQVLQENIKYADRWTILDTGSTDETLGIIEEVLVGKYPGQLVQEPFINFRDSRNQCLDLAGTSCKYNIMLDDTYIVRGDIRSFLETVRGDEFGSSFSFYIQSDDTEYTTNRVTRTELGLRYRYKIHEVIDGDNNVNVMVPREVAYIDDLRADYMEERTMARKQYDLQLLLESIEEEPECARHLYYTAQTYNLMKDYENAVKYFRLRALDETGFLQERADACFEWARVSQFQLNKPWHEVEAIYKKTLEIEPAKVEAMYFLGIYHVYDGRSNEDAAFPWFEKAFHLGYPVHIQYSLKPTLVYYFLPRFLAPMCYTRNKWQLGLDACNRLLTSLNEPVVKKVADQHVVSSIVEWQQIYQSLVNVPQGLQLARHVDIVFVIDGNWAPWTGADIETKGLGGSETWAVEMATQLKQWLPRGDVIFFCNCPVASFYKGVEFLPIRLYEQFMATHDVTTCIVSRFSHHLFVPLETQCKQVILYLHDLGPTGSILPVNPKLTEVFCLSPWHRDLFSANFSAHASKAVSLGYGIDTSKWKPGVKVPHSFVYSSFPDRGLLPLLEMWPRIKLMWPDATLRIFCNLQHDHVRRIQPAMMARIDLLLEGDGMVGVVVEGWVSKKELAAAYSAAEYWLYPCIFDETFCLTALEAVASGAIGIAPPKAALQHMPLVFVDGDALSTQWADEVVQKLCELDANVEFKARLVVNGLEFARERSWPRQALLFQTSLKVQTACEPRIFTPFYASRREVHALVNERGQGKLCNTVRSMDDYSALQFNYVSHLLQRYSNPWVVFEKYFRSCEGGLVETPSPMVELLRGIDVHKDADVMRGYAGHLYIVWSEPGDRMLHMVPKLPCVEHMPIPQEWYNAANAYPLLWNNYFVWDLTRAPVALCMHEFESVDAYYQLLRRAVEQSAAVTKMMFPHAFRPAILDGCASSVLPVIDVNAHLAALAQERAAKMEVDASILTHLQGLKAHGFMPGVIYDIGACVLEWSSVARKVWPDAEIVVFDAMAALETLYQKEGLKYFIGLLGEGDEEEVEFFENQLVPFGNSRFKEIGWSHAHQVFSDAQKRRVRMRQLDTVVREHGFPLPDLVKIDVQGSELWVLKGGSRVLRNATRLVVELQDQVYNEGAPGKAEVLAQLHSMNFEMAHQHPVGNTSSLFQTPDYDFVRRGD